MLRAVLYISDSTLSDQTLEKEQIQSIRDKSKSSNDDHQVFGVLAYHENKFFHVLEGEPHQVERLLKNIEKDSRNKNLSILVDSTSAEQIYNDWELIQAPSIKQSKLLSKFLQKNIDDLPMLEQQDHDDLEEFIINIFI